jgi:DNA mismatch endonuclease (patch repair protein)
MVDVVDSATRSRMMSGIKGSNTKPEILIRKLLHHNGFRYRLHVRDLPGKPDIVLPRYKAVVFIHGCFWHGHSCPLFKWPATRPEFWKEKIEKNRANDSKAKTKLLNSGWRVCVVWECRTRGNRKNSEEVVQLLAEWLKSNATFLEIGR